jgi:hypothetical protein
MTVSRISAACWVFFIVMCLGFLPLGIGILQIHALPEAARAVLAIAAVLVVWWGPFGYAMYLSLAVIRSGDRRLLRRGAAGTAEVLTAKATNTVIQEGEFAWQAPRVYKYGLRVSLPGRPPYDTTCSICAAGIQPGQVVNVAASRRNRKRVTIDLGQGAPKGTGVPRSAPAYARAGPGRRVMGSDGLQPGGGLRGPQPGGRLQPGGPGSGPATEAQRLAMLAQLGQLHSQGVLTDAEFAAQKAQILGF